MATKPKAPNAAKKTSVKRRAKNPVAGNGPKPGGGAPFNNQDIKRRLGNFTGAGEHARVGGRNGIVGQSKSNFKTETRKGKKES